MRLAKIIASTFVFLMGIAAVIRCFLAKIQDDQVKRLGFKAQAVVVALEKEVNKHDEGRPGRTTSVKKETIWGIYEFTDGETSYLVRGATSGATLGEKTIVYYDPKAPGKEYFLEADKYGFALGITIAVLCLIVGAVLSYRSYRL